MAKVVIDPGHFDSYNPGVIPGYTEGQMTLKLSKILGPMLEDRGATVSYTRTKYDQNPSILERGRAGANADVFISLHSDAAGGDPPDPKPRGATVYYSVKRPASKSLADSIGSGIARAMNTPFRGSKTRLYPNASDLDFYGVIRSAVDSGAKNAFLVEHGFHTNPQDCEALLNDNVLHLIAASEAKTIGDYLGLKPISSGIPYTVVRGDSLYSIGKKFKVPWQNIAANNNLKTYLLHPGQIINIPQ